MARQKWLNLGWETGDCPVVSVEFADKWFRKETKLIYGTVVGDLKRILCFLGDLLAFIERGLAVVSSAFPSLSGKRTSEKKQLLMLHGNLTISDMWTVE